MPGNRPLEVAIVGLLTLASAGAVFFLGFSPTTIYYSLWFLTIVI